MIKVKQDVFYFLLLMAIIVSFDLIVLYILFKRWMRNKHSKNDFYKKFLENKEGENMSEFNVIKIKKDGDNSAKIYIDDVEIKGLKSYRLVDAINPITGRDQELTLVIAVIEDLNVS